MKSISSRHNAVVKRLRDAVRDHGDEIVLEGRKQVVDAVASGWRPLIIAATSEDVPLPPNAGGTQVVLTREVFESISDTREPQGLLGLFERPRTQASAILTARHALCVALDGVQDPGNVGTIVRLAAAFDTSGVLLLPGCADPFAPKAIRASVGAVLNVPVATTSPAELIASGLPILAADASGDLTEPPSSSAILVFGSEGTGLSPEILRAARKIAIPMSARVESLNVAAAAAILLARSYARR